jgi:hypothetical protein
MTYASRSIKPLLLVVFLMGQWKTMAIDYAFERIEGEPILF